MSFGVSIGDVLKLCEIASRVYKNCRDCTGEYKALASEARSLTNLLEDIGDKYNGIPEPKKRQLVDAYDPCVQVLHELDKILLHYNSLDSKSKRAWDRLKWDPDKSRILRERLTSTVVMLNGFYTSLIHDNQMLILEALGRLEKDYRGGRREESIAAVERITSGAAEDGDDEDEDAAWPQIIRDLQDVGISRQDTIEYRDVIVDWFVRAVNEGRLMEQCPESHGLDHQSQATTSHGVRSQRCANRMEDITTAASCAPSSKAKWTDSPVGSPASGTFHEATTPQAEHESLVVMAQRVMQAWVERDFVAAEKYLEKQLAAVEDGETIAMGEDSFQPDRRVLRHLIAVCASYSGNLRKAKRIFESVFNGIYLSGSYLDDGDIAAARWLGDVCLQLGELDDAALAWSVALDGLIARHGISRDVTRRVYEELQCLDCWFHPFKRLAHEFAQNSDGSGIFLNVNLSEKSNLIASVQARTKQMNDSSWTSDSPKQVLRRSSSNWNRYIRPGTDWNIGEACLVGPLISINAWPLPWDPTFVPIHAISLQRHMASPIDSHGPNKESIYGGIPTTSLGGMKDLDYVTKKDAKWLVETVRAGLDELGIEQRPYGAEMACCVLQRSGCLVSSAVFMIKFRRIRFRNMCGLKVSDALWPTRGVPDPNRWTMELQHSRADFKDVVKGILGAADHD